MTNKRKDKYEMYKTCKEKTQASFHFLHLSYVYSQQMLKLKHCAKIHSMNLTILNAK